MQRVPSAAYLVPAGLLLAALLPWPYGYYQFLRLVVCACAAWIAIEAYGRQRILIAGLAAATALLFNPVMRVHFERETWAIFNVIGAIVLLAIWGLDRRGKA
jgi:hypothetical protein